MLLEPKTDQEPTKREWVGFWSMIVQQTQNAFNDKAAQFILVPLAGAISFMVPVWPGVSVGVESLAGILIALPFVLFAPLAGWLSDRFSKRDVMLGSAVFQLCILSLLFVAILIKNMPLALVGFFGLAIQSAFFSPAKIGINKELVGSKHLGFAAGIQQMTAMLAILAGQIAAGVIFDQRMESGGGTVDAAWTAAMGPLLILALLALPAIGMAIIVPRTPAQGAQKLSGRVAIEHFKHLKELWRDLPLRQAAFGVAFFWGFASFINLWSLKVAKVLTDGGEGFGTLSSWFMAAASLGMVVGFGVASMLLRRRIELGWVPFAGIAMTITALLMARVDPTGSLGLLDQESAWKAFLKSLQPSTGLFLWFLTLLAFFAALFLAPLNAWMQDRYPADKRGELQSAVNLQDCLAGILAVAFIELVYILLKLIPGMTKLEAFRWELVISGVGCGLISFYIVRLLPADLIRVMALTLLRLFYRIRPVGDENMPTKGGVLLLPNHLTWADAFFITAASPRPVRFVMDATYMKYPIIRWASKVFGTVPISIGKPREALRVASEALDAGDVVCLFPEGELSRTGTLREIRRGFELIARKAGAPSITAWMDGAWGSIFSFERNRYFKKRPYRIPYGMAVGFSPPITPDNARLSVIRQSMLNTSVDAISSRLTVWKRHGKEREMANGYQLGQVNALIRRQPFSCLSTDAEIDRIPALAGFSKLFKAKLHKHTDLTNDPVWVGGSVLRKAIENNNTDGAGRKFFDMSPNSIEPLNASGWEHYPCLEIEGLVIAMSMPDPPIPTQRSPINVGKKEGSYGILLPGFSYREEDGRVIIHGPTHKEVKLPEGYTIEEEGFVFPASRNAVTD